MRFVIAIWHGEHGSIGRLVDRKRGRLLAETSTMRDGAAFRQLLEIQQRALILAAARGDLAPPSASLT